MKRIQMLSVFAVLFGLCISQWAFCKDTAVVSRGTETPSASTALRPPTPIDHVLHFPELFSAWEKGDKASEAALAGSWKEIAQASSSPCACAADDRFNLDGVRNSDDSIKELLFDFVDQPDVTGVAKPKIFSILLKNIGQIGENQGPFRVDASEPQFSQWAYSGRSGEMAEDIFLEASCRLVKSSQDKLICALAMRMAAHPVRHDWDRATRSCISASGAGFIQVFAKE